MTLEKDSSNPPPKPLWTAPDVPHDQVSDLPPYVPYMGYFLKPGDRYKLNRQKLWRTVDRVERVGVFVQRVFAHIPPTTVQRIRFGRSPRKVEHLYDVRFDCLTIKS